MYDQDTLDVVKEASVFNLKSEDFIGSLLIKSNDYILFTLEKQKMDFYQIGTFKKSDSWDFFFDDDLSCCSKNEEGSKIIAVSKGGHCVFFNFLKP